VSALWHGGPAIKGDRVLPGSATGSTRAGGLDSWVYVTPLRSLALTYAITIGGWLYQVEAVGPVEQDPGSVLEAGSSLRCREARILRRFRPSCQEVDRVRRVMRHVEAGLPS
jgi:hypothetical protein